jgi:hypothetical protein
MEPEPAGDVELAGQDVHAVDPAGENVLTGQMITEE